jgi:hypothetical protein
MGNEKNCVYLLGAGFTHAVINKAPLTKDLMVSLNLSEFPELHEEYERSFPDIEHFISGLDLKILHYRQINGSLAGRLEKARDSIVQQIVNQVDTTQLNVCNYEEYPDLKKFIETVPAEARILTLNYDCVLDQGLYFSKRWSPFGGYCYPTFPHINNENDSKDNIHLLKLHGSVNFKDLDADQEYFIIEITDGIFPNIYSQLNSDLKDKPHVLVMSYMKQFHNGILSLWREAISSLKSSEKLIIVGCSLREEDTFLRFALNHFGMKENVDQFSIDIIDMGKVNCTKIKDKVLKLVAYPDHQQIKLFDEGLEDYLNRTQ